MERNERYERLTTETRVYRNRVPIMVHSSLAANDTQKRVFRCTSMREYWFHVNGVIVIVGFYF